MARIFITGSADGLGHTAAKSLVDLGHNVVLHARNAERGREALSKIQGAEKVLIADLSSIEETKKLAAEVNAMGNFDAVIHNAGLYKTSNDLIFSVNTLAPYILTCLIQKPKRLIYLSSGMHLQGDPSLKNLNIDASNRNDYPTYSDTKLHDVILCMAVSRKWPEVYANAVDPGWVPTKMGGRGAPDNLEKGYQTQAWLAVSNDEEAKVTGNYFYHQRQKNIYRKLVTLMCKRNSLHCVNRSPVFAFLMIDSYCLYISIRLLSLDLLISILHSLTVLNYFTILPVPMKKILKIFLWTFISIFLLIVGAASVFIYKVKNGFPVSYETEVPSIEFPAGKITVLLFSKSTGFRHGESIEAGKNIFTELATKNNWFLYSTEEGGVFNPEQLAKFDIVIFNNSTGRVLNDEQQKVLEEYVEQGGTLVGIHGAGDDSHHWDWYEKNLLGSKFSHHPIDPQLQETDIKLNSVPDSLIAQGLPTTWKHSDEWYVFFENPETKGFHILYTIDGEKINPSGNMLWMKDKNFGMGKDHPVAWYRTAGKGRTFYTSIGHNAEAWKQDAFVRMLENVVSWSKN